MELPENPTDEQIDEINRRQEFVRDGMPDRWIDYSLELQDAASELWNVRGETMELTLMHAPNHNHLSKRLANPRAYALLAGFALENSLKAQLIVEQPQFIVGGKLHRPLRTHELRGLMDRIHEMEFTEVERRIAEACETAIPYWGRYPVPLDPDGLQAEQLIEDDFQNAFVAFNFRVRKHVYEQIKDGWDSGVGPKIVKSRSKEFGDEIDTSEPSPWVTED